MTYKAHGIIINLSNKERHAANVWVEVDGKQYTVGISDVLDHEETEPFEASAELESDLDADAWNELYSQYIGE